MFFNFLKTLFIFLLILSVLNLLFFNNPMMMAISIIFQSLMTSFSMYFIIKVNWFSYFIFIIYLGGILMLILYMVSISPFFEMSWKMKKKAVFTFFIFSFYLSESFMELKSIKMNNIVKIYTNLSSLSIFLMCILIFILMSIILISESQKKNMRSKM